MSFALSAYLEGLKVDTIFHLRQHLVNSHYRDQAPILDIGPTEQLRDAVRISSSEVVNSCFDERGCPLSYPNLPDRHYLVLLQSIHYYF
jgi:hypothetical protein